MIILNNKIIRIIEIPFFNMDIRKSLIILAKGFLFVFTGVFLYTMITIWEDFRFFLVKLNIGIVWLILSSIIMVKILPDMKYSYKTKNFLGILLMIGMIMQVVFFPLGIKIAILIGTSFSSLSLLIGLIGVLIAFIEA